MIVEKIEAEINSSEFFAVIADETTDSSTKNQMSLIARYVHQGILQEKFLGFSNVSGLSGLLCGNSRLYVLFWYWSLFYEHMSSV